MSISFMGSIPWNIKPKINPEGKKVYVHNGIAVNEDFLPYDGKLIVDNKNGDEFELNYQGGTLKTSLKNGKMYKRFYDVSTDENNMHRFKDGSYLTYQQYYHAHDCATRQIRNYENKTRHFIFDNRYNCFPNEPKIFCHLTTELSKKHNELDKKIIHFNDIEEVEFEGLEEAQEYFQEKYGIEADFHDLKTAHLLKQAIDSFVPLNYKGKGEKLFENLKLKKYDSPGYASMNYELVTDKDGSLTSANHFISITPCAIPPSKIRDDKRSNFHGVDFASSYIGHELVHWLHATENPEWYAQHSEDNLSSEELKIARGVCGYGCKNKAEYVAEYAATRLENVPLSTEAYELYKKFHGPDLFKDYKSLK